MFPLISDVVSSWFPWVKVNFQVLKYVWCWFMTPLKGKARKGRSSEVGSGYRLCMMGDLKGWVGGRVRVGITGAFRVLGENENRRRVVDFCAEMRMCVWVIHTSSTRVFISTLW